MPKRIPDPRHVSLEPIKRGDRVLMPARPPDVGYIKERAPEHGVYMKLETQEHGLFVPARRLWEVLDLVIDIEDRE